MRMDRQQCQPDHPTVVHVVVGEGVSGVHRFLAALASRPDLTATNHCVALFAPDSESARFLERARLHVRSRGHEAETAWNYFRRSFGRADTKWLAQVLGEERAICVHAHTFGSFTLAARAGRRCGIPVVRTVHGFGLYDHLSGAAFQRWSLRNTDAIVAVSDHCRRVVAALGPGVAPRIRVIKNGVDLVAYDASLERGSGPFSFVVASRLVRLKQIDLAIRALAQVPNTQLHIVGDGPERDNLHRLVGSMGLRSRVIFHGFLSDPRPVIAACHVAINCSRKEGLSLFLIEAGAMGRPSIAFAVGGIPEVVQDGRTGWLTKESSVRSLADAMREAASDPDRCAAFGSNARQWVRERFGLDHMCREYGLLYGEFADSPPFRADERRPDDPISAQRRALVAQAPTK